MKYKSANKATQDSGASTQQIQALRLSSSYTATPALTRVLFDLKHAIGHGSLKAINIHVTEEGSNTPRPCMEHTQFTPTLLLCEMMISCGHERM
eukprot:750629-Pelagomonas_calceolata.AAC.1